MQRRFGLDAAFVYTLLLMSRTCFIGFYMFGGQSDVDAMKSRYFFFSVPHEVK